MSKIWARIFDNEYIHMCEDGYLTNTHVWRSFVDGQLLADEDMKEWVDNAISKILWMLKPDSKVLEVGCGNGLILSRVINHVSQYVGIDPSEITIQKLKKIYNNNSKVQFHVADASEIAGLGSNYDLIILNSVSQYFDNLNYFDSFLKAALDISSEDGSIFIGDVRSLPHSWCVERNECANHQYNYTNSQYERYFRAERETLYHPDFFRGLLGRFQNLQSLYIDLKRGGCINELSRYRYDVFLYKNLKKESILNTEESRSILNHRLVPKASISDIDYLYSTNLLSQPFNGEYFIDFNLDLGLNYMTKYTASYTRASIQTLDELEYSNNKIN